MLRPSRRPPLPIRSPHLQKHNALPGLPCLAVRPLCVCDKRMCGGASPPAASRNLWPRPERPARAGQAPGTTPRQRTIEARNDFRFKK